jgi:hypothetical protein
MVRVFVFDKIISTTLNQACMHVTAKQASRKSHFSPFQIFIDSTFFLNWKKKTNRFTFADAVREKI